MIGLAEQDLLLVSDNENDQLFGNKIFFGNAEDIIFGHSLKTGAHLFPIIRFFSVAAGEFVLGERVRDLAFGCERMRETINESAPRGVQFVIRYRGAGYLL